MEHKIETPTSTTSPSRRPRTRAASHRSCLRAVAGLLTWAALATPADAQYGAAPQSGSQADADKQPARFQPLPGAPAGNSTSEAPAGAPRPSMAEVALEKRREGQRLMLAQRHADAAREYRELVAIQPLSAVAHALLGKALTASGDFSGAIESLRRAVQLDPERPQFQTLLERATRAQRNATLKAERAAPPPQQRTGADYEPVPRDDEADVNSMFTHGFRLGYVYVMNHDQRGTAGGDSDDPQQNPSIKEAFGMKSPHQFMLGYELTARMIGQGWLDVLLIGNTTVSGLQESRFLPSANGMIGFEFNRAFQLGVGVNLAPTKDKPAHMIMAAGWTPKVGKLRVPVHAFFIPDVDQAHRVGMTVGVNWE